MHRHFTHDERDHDRGPRRAHGDWPPVFGPGFGRGPWGGGAAEAPAGAAAGAGAATSAARSSPCCPSDPCTATR